MTYDLEALSFTAIELRVVLLVVSFLAREALRLVGAAVYRPRVALDSSFLSTVDFSLAIELFLFDDSTGATVAFLYDFVDFSLAIIASFFA